MIIIDSVKKMRPGKIIKYFPDRDYAMTVGDLLRESARWGLWIQKQNTDTIGIRMGNRPEFFTILTGALRVGKKVELLPVFGSPTEEEPPIVLYDGQNKHVVNREGIDLSSVVLSDGEITEYDWSPEETMLILTTSGTSGTRKHIERKIGDFFQDSVILLWGKITRLIPIKVFNGSPWYHNTGLYMLLAILAGFSFFEITMDSFNPLLAKRAIKKYRPNLWLGTASMLYRTCLADPSKARVPFATVLTGEALNKNERLAFSRAKGFRILYCGYGTTECGNIASYLVRTRKFSVLSRLFSFFLKKIMYVDEIEDDFAGYLSPSVQAVIDSPDENGIGEICVKTPIQKEFFHTGDRGYLKEDKLYIVGRVFNVINRSGEKILSSDIEKPLCTLPGIKNAVAFGIPSVSYGEDIVLCIEGSATKEEIESVLPKKFYPSRLLVVDSIPLNSSGKKDWQALKKQILAEKEEIL